MLELFASKKIAHMRGAGGWGNVVGMTTGYDD